MPKIIDCFIFYNEVDLLTYRLALLNDVVDYFVIVESTHTFVGKEKSLFFNENKHLFEPFHKKILHIVVDDFPYKYPNVNIQNNDVWKNEFFQRNAISRGIQSINSISDSDVILISDVDEIPDPRTLNAIKKGHIVVNIHALQMDLYYYNLNTKLTCGWSLCKSITYKKYRTLNLTCNDIRMKQCPVLLNGGWHLSYFGDTHFIQNKIANFSHQELNISSYTDLSTIEERVKNSVDLYGRNYKFENIKTEENHYLPPNYEVYLKKYYT